MSLTEGREMIGLEVGRAASTLLVPFSSAMTAVVTADDARP